MPHNNKFIEGDNKLFEKNLKFVNNEVEEELNQLLGNVVNNQATAPPRDCKIVTPKPGLCIKTYQANTDEKYFINVCHEEEIPPPQDITDQELVEILQSDEPSNFRIPMSISESRTTKDTSGNTVEVCDIAVNPQFFQKCQKSVLFKDFFLAIIAETLSAKHNVQIRIDKAIILKNRKFIGTLVTHRVRNNDIKTVLDAHHSSVPLVQELDEKESKIFKQKSQQTKAKPSSLPSSNVKQEISQAASTEPEFKLRAKVNNDKVEEVQAEFYMPKCISSREISIDIGEDRIVIESMKHGYIFDKFLNYRLQQDRARAIFDKTNKMLQVRIPVYSV